MNSTHRQLAVALGIVGAACVAAVCRQPAWSPLAPARPAATAIGTPLRPTPVTPRMTSNGPHAIGEVAFLPDRDESEPGVRYGYGRRSFSVGITPGATVFAKPSAAAAEAAASRTPADIASLLPAPLGDGDTTPPFVRFRMDIVGADTSAAMHGEDAAAWRTNVYRGDDPSAWREGVPNYRRVRATGVLPGVDVVYRPQGRQVAFDFVVAPGAAPSAIALAFAVDDDTKPAVRIDARGDLVVASGAESMRFGAPVVYQDGASGRSPVAGKYALRPAADGRTEVAFEVAAYDRSRPLVIDPAVFEVTLGSASYLGGKGNDNAQGMALGLNGEIYVLTLTTAPFFAVNNFLGGATGGGYDAAVAQIQQNGAVVANAVFGGSGTDFAYAFKTAAVTGNLYVCGSTSPQSGPTAIAFPSTIGAYAGPGGATTTASRGFVVQMTPTLSLVSSAVVACNGQTGFRGISVSNQHVAVCGVSNALNFPTTPGAAFPTYPAGAFSLVSMAAVLSDDLATLQAATWVGENNGTASDVAIKPDGDLVIVGYTSGTNLPSINAPQSTPGGGVDGYVMEVNGNCTAVSVWTPVGGTGFDLLSKVWVPDVGPFADDAIFVGAGSAPFAGPTTTHSGGNDCLIGCVRPGSFVFLQWVGGTGNELPTWITGIPGGFGIQSYSTSFDRFPLAKGADPGGGASDTAFDFFTITPSSTVTSTATGLEPCRVGGSGGDVSAGFVFVPDTDGPGPDTAGILSVNTCSAADAKTTPGAAQTGNASEGAANDDAYVTKLTAGAQCPRPSAPTDLRATTEKGFSETQLSVDWDYDRDERPAIDRFTVVVRPQLTPGVVSVHVDVTSLTFTRKLVPPGLYDIDVTCLNTCESESLPAELLDVVFPDPGTRGATYASSARELRIKMKRNSVFAYPVLVTGTATVAGVGIDVASVSSASPGLDWSAAPPAHAKATKTTKFAVAGHVRVEAGSKTAVLPFAPEAITVPVKFVLKITVNGVSKSVKFTLKPKKP